MKKLSDSGVNRRYSSQDVHTKLIEDFLVPCLEHSTTYWRAAGYFRSSIFELIAPALSDFCLRGGKIRMLCSPALTQADTDEILAIEKTKRYLVQEAVDRDLETLLEQERWQSGVNFLATLMQHELLEIRVAYKDGPGIFHPKCAVFADGTNALSFTGSANETVQAWCYNEETILVSRDWIDDKEREDVNWERDYFDMNWNGLQDGFKTTALSDVSVEKIAEHALPSVEEAKERLCEDLQRGEMQKAGRDNAKQKKSGKILQSHQIEARNNWWANKRGIISFVTGGGKTFTAIAIMDRWFDEYPNGVAVVLVPSNLLAKQWRKELEEADYWILQAGGDETNPKWRDNLRDHTKPTPDQQRRVVLAVMNSAATDDFVNRVAEGETTLLIADEVHKVGSTNRRRSLEIDAGGRLGLSATPERFGDPEGTQAIFHYFGEKIEPEFTIRDAQSATPPRLVDYFFNHHFVELEAKERERYDELTKKIMGFGGDIDNLEDEQSAVLKRLLIQRSKVLKSAKGKVTGAVNLLSAEFKAGQRWLIYCDDNKQLKEIRDLLNDEPGQIEKTRVWEYTSMMQFDQDATIEQFEVLGGILLSIECLDEGVDIPSISHALILASSTNPRQHLQRRGRVLRTSGNKSHAVIWDTLVTTEADGKEVVFDVDLARARSFGEDATNAGQVERRLDQLTPFSERGGDAGRDFEEEEDDDEH